MERTATSIDEKNSQWSEARRLWLGGLSANTARAYGQAWASFAESCGVEAWEVGRADVARWVQEMRDRELSDGTIGQRVAAVGSFYRYCCEEYQVVIEGREQPLATINPASGKTLRPKVERYGKVRALTQDETRALLAAIISFGKTKSPIRKLQAVRDYVLFLGYLYTGRRNSEWRAIQWGDFWIAGNVVWYRWNGKGKKGVIEVPKPVWDEMKAYLTITGRYDNIKSDDYIFRGQSDHNPEENIPLAINQVGKLLKKYCRRAHLNAKEIHVHTLRHTAVKLRRDAGEELVEISRWLGHSSLAVTQIYLDQVEKPRDASWEKVSAMLGIGTENRDDKRSYRPYMRRRAK